MVEYTEMEINTAESEDQKKQGFDIVNMFNLTPKLRTGLHYNNASFTNNDSNEYRLSAYEQQQLQEEQEQGQEDQDNSWN